MNNKTIYIDGWFLQPPLRGVGKYIKNLLTYLENKNNTLNYILLIPRKDLELSYLPENISIEIYSYNKSLDYLTKYLDNIWKIPINIID